VIEVLKIFFTLYDKEYSFQFIYINEAYKRKFLSRPRPNCIATLASLTHAKQRQSEVELFARFNL
jgi:hypothetical protein